MRCPYCTSLHNKVIDSRVAKEGASIRRRRECEACAKRFTTHEQVEESLPLIIKKDGRREPFDAAKISSGLKKACEKRPISVETLETIVKNIENKLLETGEKEVSSNMLGEIVMEQLKNLDEVAYVRFASVYRSFKDVGEFVSLIESRHAR